MRNPRILVAAGVVVLVAVAAVGVLVTRPDGDAAEVRTDEPPRVVRATLTLEQARRPDTGGRELLVSLPGPQLNTPEVTGGEPLVLLRCFDAGGAMVLRQPVDWPLPEEAGFPPHIHRPAERALLDRIRRCRLTGRGILFEGSVPGRLPVFG